MGHMLMPLLESRGPILTARAWALLGWIKIPGIFVELRLTPL